MTCAASASEVMIQIWFMWLLIINAQKRNTKDILQVIKGWSSATTCITLKKTHTKLLNYLYYYYYYYWVVTHLLACLQWNGWALKSPAVALLQLQTYCIILQESFFRLAMKAETELYECIMCAGVVQCNAGMTVDISHCLFVGGDNHIFTRCVTIFCQVFTFYVFPLWCYRVINWNITIHVTVWQHVPPCRCLRMVGSVILSEIHEWLAQKLVLKPRSL